MCSKNCIEKMKILCLNTVQVLFKDAFDKFSNNLSNQISILDQNNQPDESHHQFDLNKETNQNDSTCFCLKTSINDLVDSQQSSSSKLSADDLNKKELKENLIVDQNSQNSQPNEQLNDRVPSQLILCNLMQNLVDAINEQCIKQLPKPTNEKKKRKRKRKRKKSKLTNDPMENEISIEKFCPFKDHQGIHEAGDKIVKKMKRTEYFTDEQSKSIDKIRRMNVRSSISKSTIGDANDISLSTESCKLRAAQLKSNVQSTNESNFPIKNTRKMKIKSSSNLNQNFSQNLTQNLVPQSSSSLHHNLNDGKWLKRKRDEDLSNQANKKRITSARKPPTIYKRKHHLTSSSSSYSDDNDSSSDDSSSTNSYSSSNEIDNDEYKRRRKDF